MRKDVAWGGCVQLPFTSFLRWIERGEAGLIYNFGLPNCIVFQSLSLHRKRSLSA
jgi:hypothetical protein